MIPITPTQQLIHDVLVSFGYGNSKPPENPTNKLLPQSKIILEAVYSKLLDTPQGPFLNRKDYDYLVKRINEKRSLIINFFKKQRFYDMENKHRLKGNVASWAARIAWKRRREQKSLSESSRYSSASYPVSNSDSSSFYSLVPLKSLCDECFKRTTLYRLLEQFDENSGQIQIGSDDMENDEQIEKREIQEILEKHGFLI